jgi:hypothetical protein
VKPTPNDGVNECRHLMPARGGGYLLPDQFSHMEPEAHLQELQSHGLRSEAQERQKNEVHRLSQMEVRRMLENRAG